jgi:hypothetical protein
VVISLMAAQTDGKTGSHGIVIRYKKTTGRVHQLQSAEYVGLQIILQMELC